MREVRWGVVGTGGIGKRTVGDLRLCENTRVVAVASRLRETAEAFSQEWDIPLAFGQFDLMCQSSEVDAIYIGTPHTTHFSYAKRALESGKHVVCEKPLTMQPEEAAELGELAAKNKVFLMEAMWMKFTPGMQKFIEVIRSGVIGEPRFLQAGLGFAVPKDGPRRYWDPELGGGALYDMGIYPITLAQMIFGEVESITASGVMREDGVDLHEAYLLNFTGGGTAQLVTSITFFVPPQGWLGGTKGSIELNQPLWSPRSITVTQGKPPHPPEVEKIEFEIEGAGYVPMFRAANSAIMAGRIEHPQHPISNTVDALQIMRKIRESLG